MNFNVKCIRGPYWLPDEHTQADEHYGYECTIDGKSIIIGEEPADEFRYVYETDKKTYDLYTKNKKVLMPLIAKAIKAHELKSSLTPKTQQTFNDLINEL
jgi:hypothetical protein